MADRCLLYYITDRSQFYGSELDRRRALLAKVAEAACAGVDYIQLRERDLSARELEALARDARTTVLNSAPPGNENWELRTELKTRILINSRTDVALATAVDGVHLRADDLSPDEVRQLLKGCTCWSLTGDDFLVAVSCHTDEDIKRAESEAVDFAVFAPVFGKHSAPGTQPTGLDALRDVCQAKIPIFALGGITVENARSCLNAGAAGIAGIRLFQENKIEDVVRALRAL
ncbi:MAG: thiamine phosphate synthase [Terriglobales bacterium]